MKKIRLGEIKNSLSSLFAMTNPHTRGKDLEGVLNDLFNAYGIGIRETFTLCGDNGEGIIEQIDGVIEFKNRLYLVEMKWWKEPVGKGDIAPHLVRLMSRADVNGLIIFASNFTEATISQCIEFLQQRIVMLATLEEVFHVLNYEADLQEILAQKLYVASLDKNPWFPYYSL